MNAELSTLHLELSGVSTEARNDLEFWRERIEPLLSLQKGVVAELKLIASTTGLPYKTVERKFYQAKRGGLIALLDRRLAGPRWWNLKTQVGLSAEDKALVKLYCERNQRSSRSAIKQLRRDWRLGRVKTQTPVDPRTSFPRGWSIDNLDRAKPTRIALKSVRIGRSAAASERPLVYTTRKGLYVGSHYMLDDMWHDFEVNSLAGRQAGRPLELFSHDLYSARKVRWGVRVRTRKDDGTYHGLTRKMTRLIVAATLYLDGYSDRGTVTVVEGGAAGIDDKLAQLLFDSTGGKITRSESGMQGAKTHAGMYDGVSRGNPRHKASLESSNNLTHNVFALLPGQTGLNRTRTPEEHPAMMRNNEDLLAAHSQFIDDGRADRAALLQFPVLSLEQFTIVAHELYRQIEEDVDHDLEGWDLHTTTELLIGGQWIDQRSLLQDPAQAQLALMLVQGGHVQTRPRKLSRREVWNAGAGELKRIPGHIVVAILGDDLAVERKVRGNRFEFEDAEVGLGLHRFDSLAFNPYGEAIRLSDRETYETFVNPFASDSLFVRRANGSYIGECRRIHAPCRSDIEAVHRACGHAAATEAELLEPVRKRHLQEGREKAARHTNNAQVLGRNPVTMAERMRRIADEKLVTSANDFLPNETSADLLDEAQNDEVPAGFNSEDLEKQPPIASASEFI